MYGNAVVIGLSPRDIDAMSLAQYLAVCDGWARAHEDPDVPAAPPTDEEFEAVMRHGG